MSTSDPRATMVLHVERPGGADNTPGPTPKESSSMRAHHTGSVTGTVYFIQSADGGPIKIGFSTDLRERIKALQAGSPVLLKVVGMIPGTVRDEWRWHRRFSAHRLHGEWFAPDLDLLDAIQREARHAPHVAKPFGKPRTIPGRYWPLARRAFALMGDDNNYISAADLAECSGLKLQTTATCLTYLFRNGWLDVSFVKGTGTRLYRRRRFRSL